MYINIINRICDSDICKSLNLIISFFPLSSYFIDVFLVSGPDHLRVFFGHDPLEDHLTLKFYKIQHLSVLCFVMKMPTGEGVSGMSLIYTTNHLIFNYYYLIYIIYHLFYCYSLVILCVYILYFLLFLIYCLIWFEGMFVFMSRRSENVSISRFLA